MKTGTARYAEHYEVAAYGQSVRSVGAITTGGANLSMIVALGGRFLSCLLFT